MAKANPEAQNKAPTGNGEILVKEFDYWRGLAVELNPALATKAEKSDDVDWQLNELAIALQETACLISAHWTTIQKVASKAEKKAASFSVKVDINRLNMPSEVDAKVSYSESYSESVKRKVPDPNQTVMDMPDGDPETE
jgi:hypothetical protein